MFRFIKIVFVAQMAFFNCNLLKFVSMNNQEYTVRSEIMNINSSEPYPYSVKINKVSGTCNNINDPYAKLCFPDVVKNMNVKAFNPISRTNETKYIKIHENCKCECKELIDKEIHDKGFIWNPSNCECECDKSCDVGEYLDNKNYRCRKKLVDEFVEQCIKILMRKNYIPIK